MRNLVSILILALFPISTFAGVNGGGVGPRPEMGMLSANSEIVFHMGEADGAVRFAVGKLVDKQWQIQKFEISASSLADRRDVVSALEESKRLNQWTEIK